MSRPVLGAGRNELINYSNSSRAKKIINAYKYELKSVVSAMGFHPDKKTDKMIDDYVNFEVALAKVRTEVKSL